MLKCLNQEREISRSPYNHVKVSDNGLGGLGIVDVDGAVTRRVSSLETLGSNLSLMTYIL